MTKFFNWELYAGHALLAKTDQWNGCSLCNGSKLMNQSEMAFRELRATGILNCTVIMQVDISMFITFANWPLNVCELTSTRLRTDQRRLWNDRWRNDRLPFWPVPQDSQLKILQIAQNSQWEASDIWHFLSCNVRKGHHSKARSIESMDTCIKV